MATLGGILAAVVVVGWAASLDVDSRSLTALSIAQTVPVPTGTLTPTPSNTPTPVTPTSTPTPTNTPTPVPASTLFMHGTPGQGTLQLSPPATQNSVNVIPGTPRYGMSVVGAVTSASNASNWTMTLVSNGSLGSRNTTLNVAVYWQDGGTTCTAPVAGRVFAQVSGFALTGRPNLQGYTITLTPVSGTVSRTFDANDRLCFRIQNTGANNMGYRTGINSTSGVAGVSRLMGPLVRP